jgi:membrane-anchored glycerophosphoryl diester phosphodiesterase (GDPDase)
MRTRSINPGRLLQDSFAAVGSVYGSLLVFGVPSLLLVLLNSFIPSQAVQIILNLIFYFVIIPWVGGAGIFYTYQYLNRNRVSIGQAMQHASGKITQLVLGFILIVIILIPGFILLIIPGIYLSIRLSFVLYAIVINNCSATEGISRSWQLVKGRWWSVFLASIVITFVLFFPIGLIGGIIGAILGSDANPAVPQLLGGILGLLVSPIFTVYYTLLYKSIHPDERTSP